ncbi:MAG: efflux RND transporter periplasmic adaptor subunit [Candidatus Cryptobacteroides sp.]
MKKGLLAIILTALIFQACGEAPAVKEKTGYKTLTTTREDRVLTSEYPAQLKGCQEVDIRPQVSGLITGICIGEGQTVKKGQPLFKIDEVPFKAALAQAKANVKSAEAALASARLKYESTEVLREKNVVQDYDLSEARNNLASAEAALAQAKAQETIASNNLSYATVKSPVNGIAGMIPYRVGALVSSSITEPLVTVTDDSSIFAYFSLNEKALADILEQYGSVESLIRNLPEVSLRMANGKEYDRKGRLTAVSGIVDSQTGSVLLRADFPNPDRILLNGGSASVCVPEVRKQCIVIPQSATFEVQDRTFVYKVIDGKAHSARISVYRLSNGTEYIVESGLEEGEVIIAEGAGLVKEGDEI